MGAKRRCSVCCTENTPQWRRSRYTHKDLCNACGTRELRSATGYSGSKRKSGSRKSNNLKQKVLRTTYHDTTTSDVTFEIEAGPEKTSRNRHGESGSVDSHKDTEPTSSGTSSEVCAYDNGRDSPTDLNHEDLNQQEILSCLMMLRFENNVKLADEVVQVHPMYGGIQILRSMGQFDCPQEMDLVKDLLDLAVILSDNYLSQSQRGQQRQQEDQRIYEAKRRYCALLQDIIYMRTNKFQLPKRKGK